MTHDTDSILISIKKLLNIEDVDTAFDADIIMLINSEFVTLQQLGVGPASGFSIQGPEDTWVEYVDDPLLRETARTYIYLRVRMIFDPPASSVVSDAINARMSELEWRLQHQAEYDRMQEDHIVTQNKSKYTEE